MARLIRSAADPWITVLMAVRSARFRWRPGRSANAADCPPPAEDSRSIPCSPTFGQYPVEKFSIPGYPSK